ncbi:hypothetical protein Asulf_00543 [Archaeoglobus sulfaticallidus PM70-1]|uniref:Carboxymuconolactone decarboxylase-like domain-containing protein n=1 Tax=Archaeoglobus sulfaticallidus PM70-1 TaxID=387631 RepID=N0BAE6_9EURY|nr:carboxymuconolactone decarboxylase family protein [Archaeoglobus sulfaticallidus]AGK60564.1 hypothetical protein Asulf_00543 [Archaeoglobus sulfaticallidus PM70-1]
MDPLDVIKNLDEEGYTSFKVVEEAAFSEGSIPLKYKYLMAMVVDAVEGAVEGVKVLAVRAMENGATKEEVAEALRVAYYIGGAGAVYTSANALRDLLQE